MARRRPLRPKNLAVIACLTLLLSACPQPEHAGEEPIPPAPAPMSSAEETVTVPAGSEDEPVPVAVAVADAGAESEPLSLRFVSPNRGPAAGGNEIIIDGQGFAEHPWVHFGDVQAWIRRVTPTEIRVTVPPPAPSATGELRVVDVTVTNPPSGSSPPLSASLVQAYSYEAAGEGAAGAPAVEAPETQAGTPPPVSETQPATETERVPQGPALVARFRFEVASEGAEECPPGRRIRFSDRSTGGATQWLWELGDGETSTEQHPEHCYATPGLRSVNLSVRNGEQSASASEIVIVGME